VGSILDGMPGVSSRSLADVARDVTADAATPADLHAAFLAATVYCERGDEPGFRALGAAGEGLIPVYSSPEQLALARGTVPWFALTGSELLDLLPAGYDLLLDQGGPAPLQLRPAALVRRVSIDIEREAAG
jgi:SseB protein N-terminal domain